MLKFIKKLSNTEAELKKSVACKKNVYLVYTVPNAGAKPGIFRSRGGFLKKWHFDKRFMYDMQKKGEILVFFLQDILITVF